MRNRNRHALRGFSLLEVILVTAVASVVAAMAIIQIGNLLPGMRADSGANQVLRAVRQARHSAIADRRTTQINFTGNNQIQLLQLPAGGGVAVPLTGPTPLEGGAQFVVFPGVPDTPMGFGNNTPISFTNPANPAGGLPATQFLADGSFDVAINVPVNGIVFIGIPGRPMTARAVTILGSTGRIHVYKWNGVNWLE